VLFLCILGLVVAVPLVVMCLQVVSPLEYDYGEGIVLFQARHITDLHVAYRRIATPPFVVFHYPPVYYLLVRLADRFVGNTLISGRLTSVACTLGMLLAIGVLVYRVIPACWSRTDRLIFALVAACLPLQLDAMRWAAFMRVDMASLLFSYAALSIFILGGTRLGPQIVAVLLFVAAFYTKQSTMAGALACLAAAAILSLRRAVALALFAAALVVGLGAAGNALTGGGFLTNLFGYNLNPFSPMRALAGFVQCFASLGLVLPLALVVIWTQLARFRGLSFRSPLTRLRASLAHVSLRRALVVLSMHFALTLASVVAYGKIGSSANYYLDFQVCACVLAAFMLFTLYARPELPARTLNLPRSLAPAIAISLGLAVGALLVAVRVASIYRSAETPARISEAARVVHEIRAAGGPVWSDNMTLLVQAGKDVVAEPAIVSVLARTGRWDESGLVRMLRQGRIALIVVHQDVDSDNFYSPGVRRAIQEDYSLADRIGEYSLYRPKP